MKLFVTLRWEKEGREQVSEHNWKLILCQLFHLLLFSPIPRVVFSPCFAVQKLLSLIRSHLFTFVFIPIILGGGP